MIVPTIEIGNETESFQPSMRLAQTSLGSIWQYMGCCLNSLGDTPEHKVERDLNRAAERAAQALLKKVSSRNIDVELVIDPMIPPLNIDNEHAASDRGNPARNTAWRKSMIWPISA